MANLCKEHNHGYRRGRGDSTRQGQSQEAEQQPWEAATQRRSPARTTTTLLVTRVAVFFKPEKGEPTFEEVIHNFFREILFKLDILDASPLSSDACPWPMPDTSEWLPARSKMSRNAKKKVQAVREAKQQPEEVAATA